jgi:uncharacterized protein involved in response to NO
MLRVSAGGAARAGAAADLLPASPRAGRGDRFLSRPFIWAALVAALLPGFGAGMVLFAALLWRWPLGPWWPAAAQAHGHAQVFGFAGLMVLGVGLYFLPRLRGAPLVQPALVPVVLALYGGGLLLHITLQTAGPFIPLGPDTRLLGATAAIILALSGPFTLLGAALAFALLLRTGRHGPPLQTRPGVRQVQALVLVSFVSLLIALALNACATLVSGAAAFAAYGAAGTGLATGAAATGGTPEAGATIPALGSVTPLPPWLLPPIPHLAAVRLAFLGWLVPVAVAFSARNFPLFLHTRMAPSGALRLGLAVLLCGLVLDVSVRLGLAAPAPAVAVAYALEGGALIWFTAIIGALGPKVRLPGRMSDPVEAQLARATWPALSGAYVWLVIAGLLMLARSGATLGLWSPPPEDAERHALGAGFILLLIVGMALRLIPGFAGARPRTVDLPAARVAIAAAHVAAALRVGPVVLSWLPVAVPSLVPWLLPALLTMAGLVGMAAIVALAMALRVPLGLAAASGRRGHADQREH